MSAVHQHDHAALAAAVSPADRARLGRRALLLAVASVTYNLVEAVIAVAAGLVAGSVALVGFGLDSVIEVSSGLIIVWQFRHRLPRNREGPALRLIAVSFYALAAYVSVESLRSLVTGAGADPSTVGIGLAAASLLIMPFLSWAQRRTGRSLHSSSVVADSKQTLLCTYMSAVLLGGLVLNSTVGWSWADPVAGLLIAAIAVREGRQAWRGEGCCAPAAPDLPARTPTASASLPMAACTLPTAEQPLRVAEFSALFAETSTGVDVHGPTGATFHLTGGAGVLERTRDLAAREAGCCSFFGFTITDRPGGALDLGVTVPTRHADVLAGLVAIAGHASSASTRGLRADRAAERSRRSE